MMEKIVYRVEFKDNHCEIKLRNVLFRDYKDAEAYFDEKVEDNTGRYKDIKLIEFKTVETETVLIKG